MDRRQFLKGLISAPLVIAAGRYLPTAAAPKKAKRKNSRLSIQDGDHVVTYRPYIDKKAARASERFTVIYETDHDLIVRVRDAKFERPVIEL